MFVVLILESGELKHFFFPLEENHKTFKRSFSLIFFFHLFGSSFNSKVETVKVQPTVGRGKEMIRGFDLASALLDWWFPVIGR